MESLSKRPYGKREATWDGNQWVGVKPYEVVEVDDSTVNSIDVTIKAKCGDVISKAIDILGTDHVKTKLSDDEIAEVSKAAKDKRDEFYAAKFAIAEIK